MARRRALPLAAGALARLARIGAVIAGVAIAAWLLAEAAPGSPGERAARAGGILPPDDGSAPAGLRERIAARVAAEHDLDRPLPARIAGYLGGLARLDLGRSWRDRTPVAPRLGSAGGRTVLLSAFALGLASAFGLAFALLAARRPGRPLDVLLSGLGAVAIALPPAWVGMVGLRLAGASDPFSVTGLWLPILTLALVPGFVIARHARAALLERAGEPWALAARARGASRDRVLAVHALRASAGDLLPLLPALTAYLLGASLVVERVFGVRGLGELVVGAAARGDAPVVVGSCVVAGALLAMVSEGADALAAALDPRRRREERA